MKTRVNSNEDGYGISRIDDDVNHTHAWRVSLRRYGKRHVKNFPDRKYGDGEKALTSARAYRDDFLMTHPPISRKEVCSVKRSNNKSGVTGVCSYAKRYQRRDGTIKENWYWEASWPSARGDHIKEVFSVNTYGDEIARQMAIRARQEGLSSLEGAFWSSERGLVAHYDPACNSHVA
ncbi:MAG: AP2 domain-containing protein [Halioglobus sp.]